MKKHTLHLFVGFIIVLSVLNLQVFAYPELKTVKDQKKFFKTLEAKPGQELELEFKSSDIEIFGTRENKITISVEILTF